MSSDESSISHKRIDSKSKLDTSYFTISSQEDIYIEGYTFMYKHTQKDLSCSFIPVAVRPMNLCVCVWSGGVSETVLK